MVRSLCQCAKLERAGYLCRNQLAIQACTCTDECDFGAVNHDGQSSLDTAAELPFESKSSVRHRGVWYFQGYGKLRERDDWPTGRDDSDTIPIRRLKSYGRSVVTPCGSIVVSCKLYSQLCNPGDEVQTRFSLSVAVHHDKRDRALLTDEGDADRIFCSARYAVGQQGYGMLLSPQCFDIACSSVL